VSTKTLPRNIFLVAEAQFLYSSSDKKGATTDDGNAIQEETFGPEEDKTLLELVDSIGNWWKRICQILAQQFGLRERTAIDDWAKGLME
jgi:hypothetical protein